MNENTCRMAFVSQQAFIFKSVTAARYSGGHTYLQVLILDGTARQQLQHESFVRVNLSRHALRNYFSLANVLGPAGQGNLNKSPASGLAPRRPPAIPQRPQGR